MSIIRKRSASNNALIPNNARENQYILAEFPIDDALLSRFNGAELEAVDQPYNNFYQKLSDCFFNLCGQFEIKNCQFIANNKLARVRFSNEMHQWQTNQQILFYYNPSLHELNKTFYDGTQKADKITLLFLGSGLDIKLNAALLHNKVVKLLKQLVQKLALKPGQLRVRDHQHITYDVFAKQKGYEHNKSQKYPEIKSYYQNHHMVLNQAISEMNYAVVKIPVTQHLLSLIEVDQDSVDPYNPLYTFITDAFSQAAKRYNLNNGALIANGLVPIVRYGEQESIYTKGELQILCYNPEQNPCGLISKWNAKELVDYIQLIFVANQENKTEFGYGKFVNQVEQALKLIATELELSPLDDEMIMRFHQHIAYNI